MTLITSIAKNIFLSGEQLDILIQEFLDGEYYRGLSTTVSQWRLDNYEQLRKWAYPQMTEYNDAQVKINSGIPEMETEGQNQLNNYVQACLDVKARFPKE